MLSTKGKRGGILVGLFPDFLLPSCWAVFEDQHRPPGLQGTDVCTGVMSQEHKTFAVLFGAFALWVCPF